MNKLKQLKELIEEYLITKSDNTLQEIQTAYQTDIDIDKLYQCVTAAIYWKINVEPTIDEFVILDEMCEAYKITSPPLKHLTYPSATYIKTIINTQEVAEVLAAILMAATPSERKTISEIFESELMGTEIALIMRNIRGIKMTEDLLRDFFAIAIARKHLLSRG